MSTVAGLAGGIGYLAGAGLYVKAIWAPGKEKPDRLSWLGWSIQATALTLPLSQAVSPVAHSGPASSAAAAALALPAAQALSSWLIFALTLRRGRGRSLTDWFADVASLVGTAAAVTLWAASRGAVVPAAALLVIEGIGIVRTAWWAWHCPGCEPVLPWCVWAGCGGCEFFAVPAGASWVAAWFYPAFYAGCGLLVAGAARMARPAVPASDLRRFTGEAHTGAAREHAAQLAGLLARADISTAGAGALNPVTRLRQSFSYRHVSLP